MDTILEQSRQLQQALTQFVLDAEGDLAASLELYAASNSRPHNTRQDVNYEQKLLVDSFLTEGKVGEKTPLEIFIDAHSELSTLMQVAIENAGAEKRILILERRGQLVIEGVGKSGVSDIVVLQSIPFAKYDDLPKSLINYVFRTKETLIYSNLAKESQNFSYPYIRPLA